MTQLKKKEIYDLFSDLEMQSEKTLETIKGMRQQIAALIEENQALQFENKHLRDRLEVAGSPVKKESGLTQSRLNLENIYEDGFHVCNVMFGKRREEDEPCAFCLEVIYGQRN
ncbi:DNA replication initiation control protein YabA [Allofustis seminis]|uniref:DNA replication initiation control protein YabA n=1 Tax=Allofustis seminis TaxID=166939 RepID=UPI000371EDD6|nr:DNA replication initiation control protein YabA [Allofustis seminis]